MEIIKVVLFLYASASPVFSSDSARRLYYEPSSMNDNRCICYPRNQAHTSVPDILDSRNNGLERLVIYIYQNIDTKEIKMYTPNARKQSKIPDLPFEIGDGLITVNEDLAYEIFYKNPNRIVLDNVRHKIKDNTRVTPIGLEVGDIEEVNNESVQSITVPNIYVVEVVASPQEKGVVIPKKDFDDSGSSVWSGINVDPYVKIRPIAKPWHKQVQNENWKGTAHKSSWYRPEKHWIINSEIVVPSTDEKQYLTFDEWFIKQMKTFQNVNLPGDIHSINIITLRSSIQKTLKENNMYVTADGVLRDSYGTALDVTNLELRPILLGNPMEYQQIMHGSHHLKLPKDLPYLEGLLVTLIYPPKVLGIIPLGKTTLSHVFSSKRTKQASVKVSAAPKVFPNVADSVPHKVKLDKEPIPSIVLDSPHKVDAQSIVTKKMSERPVIKHEYVPVKDNTNNGKKRVKKISKSKLKKIPDDSKAEDIVGAEINQNQSRRLITGKILSKLYKMLTDSRQGHVEDPDNDEETDVEELPDFRIIGGNAATSSGAPVSNKGRSGINV